MAISSENGKTAEAQLPTKHNSDSEMRDEDHAAEEQQKSQQSMASDAQKETSNAGETASDADKQQDAQSGAEQRGVAAADEEQPAAPRLLLTEPVSPEFFLPWRPQWQERKLDPPGRFR